MKNLLKRVVRGCIKRWQTWSRKKRLAFIVFCMLLLVLFFQYRVVNVYDEIALASSSIIPYTQTNIRSIDIHWTASRDLSAYGYPDSHFTYHPDDKFVMEFELRKPILSISMRWLKLDYARISVEYEYNFWTKCLEPTMWVCEYEDDGTIGWEPLMDKDRIEELFQKNNTSLEEVYSLFRNKLDDMLKDWISSNEGKSKFSEDDFGWCIEGELKFPEEWYDEEEDGREG